MREIDGKLIKAIKEDNIDSIKLLLADGADINCEDDNDKYEWKEASARDYTAFMYAIEKGNPEMIDYLIKLGARINPEFKGRNSPLLVAVHYQKPEIASLLLDNGADINWRGPAVDNCSAAFWTPLYWAALYEMEEIVRTLLKYKPEINEQMEPYDDTALHRAVYCFNAEIVRMLLEKGADFNIKDKSGRSPLDIAVFMNQIEERRQECKTYGDFHEKQDHECIVSLFKEFGANIF